MVKKSFKKSGKLLENIINSAFIPLKKKKDSGFDEFVEEFYQFQSERDLAKYEPKTLAAIALDSFSFLKIREKGQAKVRVFDPCKETNGWDSQYTILEIINDDMPFLVDSITEEIARHHLSIYHVFHPVLSVKRNKKGVLSEIKKITSEKSGKDAESVIHFQISHIANEKHLAKFESDIRKVLDAVKISVIDWKKIVSKVDCIIDELTECSIGSCKKVLVGNSKKEIQNNIPEIVDFLKWLCDDNFVFLGYTTHDFKGRSKNHIVSKKDSLGLCRLNSDESKLGSNEIYLRRTGKLKNKLNLLNITKTNRKSLVHRPVHMDHISIKRLDEKGNLIGEHCFLGMFTSIVYFQSATQIPILRYKIDAVRRKSGFLHTGHNSKSLGAILEDFPRDELFQSTEEQLLSTAMGIVGLTAKPQVKLFIRQDEYERFISCLIFIPRDLMTTKLRKDMEEVLMAAFNGTISNHYTQITEAHLARLQVIVKTTPGKVPSFNIAQIEEKLHDCSRLWNDDLREELFIRFGEKKGEKIYNRYKNAFSISYTNRFSAEDAYYDIKQVDEVIKVGNISFDLYESFEINSNILHLKIYHPNEQINLSKIMPILENFGLNTIDEHTYLALPSHCDCPIWIHRFRFVVNGIEKPNLWEIKKSFENTLEKIWGEEIQNDGINQLVLTAGIEWRQLSLVRAYSKYLQQIGFTYSQLYIHEAIAAHPNFIKILIELFYAKFSPETYNKKIANGLAETFEKELGNITNLAEDRILRGFLALVNSTLRTNYFQRDKKGNHKKYISFKFDSANMSNLPLPRPHAEIFVYSPRVEGIHLRGGKVARGGLRWSDRREDFRTEVLGLMKAQMTKNSVIIPVGSKGGFVVKKPPVNGGREEFIKEGIECYKTFLRGILDITDNVVAEKIVPPKDVVRYDNDDPYLVVAADKGTATFSDIANDVSKEYNFWLGDAFASGGSAGYDHKKMGITARGAWISVERHFREMGLDVYKDDFTVIGIGDMAGDVFGNGMLLSDRIKLVGAFNHMHIFVDPNPNPQDSFKERKRLFKKHGSSWLDYDKSLISKGGGIFERNAKTIKLSKEIKELVSTDQNSVTPDELIKLLLKSDTDLLWNGGIGTYIKSKTESHDDVGDKTNDNLRINGEDLRVKVVGEGGNLGLTQLGRIEFANRGGRINTDSIDNSAGVDCSDHEVNIKIALGKAVENKKLTLKARDKLLEDMTDEVAQLVLKDNKLQTQSITIAQMQGHLILEQQARLMNGLEKQGYLNREVEFLPNSEDIANLHAIGGGLVRPQISVIMAYSKLDLYNELVNSKLTNDLYYTSDLFLYFPKKMRKKFEKEIINHPLRKEIVATSLANSIINRIGSVSLFHLKEESGMNICDIARAYTVARDAYDLRSIWSDIENISGKVNVEAQIELYLEVRNLIERVSLWLLRYHKQPINMTEAVETFSKGVKELSACLTEILPEIPAKVFDDRYKKYRNFNVPVELAKKCAGFEAMTSACDIVQVANQNDLSVKIVGQVYFEIGARLHFGWMRRTLKSVSGNSYWHNLSVNTLIDDLFDQQKRLTNEVIKLMRKEKSEVNATEKWLEKNTAQIARFENFIKDLKAQENIDYSMLVVASRKAKEICSV